VNLRSPLKVSIFFCVVGVPPIFGFKYKVKTKIIEAIFIECSCARTDCY
jgi:hypothetical protein